MMVGGTAELLWTARTVVLEAAARDRWSVDDETGAIIAEFAGEHARVVAPPRGPLAEAAAAFQLDPAEVAALAVVAAVEIDVRFGALMARLQGNAMLRPTVGTLLELTGMDGVAAFLPGRALRRNVLIDLDGDGPLPFRTVRCPDDCWARLGGSPSAPPAPADELEDLIVPADLAAAIRDVADWLHAGAGEHPLVVLWGRPGSGRHAVARAILAMHGRRGVELSADAIAERRGFVEIERDARWGGHVPVLTSDAAVPSPAARTWLDTAHGARLWIQAHAPDWLVDSAVPARVVHVPELDAERRGELWRRALRSSVPDALSGELATRFRYGPSRIARVIAMARGPDGVSVESVTAATRATSRPGIGLLAERLPPRSRDELVVSPSTARQIDVAIAWAGSHVQLYGAWGLTTSVARARGFTCLFSGPPGTGKTLGAQIVAGAIDRDLFRVDLSQAVSKWLGETEKNLGRVFDEARDAGAVLFFDEADALFARRTQVRDSNDRYANLETGYLLQRVESHDGVVILATNRRQDLDSAFLRRFEVIIEFAAPGPAERELLWRRHLPDQRRCAADVDPPALARLFELSGGQIRNAIITSIALTSLDDHFALERELHSPRLEMRHLVGGATRELLRAGRLVNPADFGAWASTVRAVAGATGQPT